MTRWTTPVSRPSWRHAAVTAAGVGAVAMAAWLYPASVHIVSWPPAGPTRVALFAPLINLEWLIAAAVLVAVLLVAWSSRVGILERVAAVAAPLCLLWVWIVPYLPWLPDRFPLLLVLAGPIRWVVACLAVVAAAGSMLRGRAFVPEQGWMPRRAVFWLGLAVYVTFGLYSARVIGPGGDEPHYLIIAQSLLADGDLQIEDNHQRREYSSFVGGELRPDYFRRGANGEIYSVHAAGLPVLLLPVYAVFGYLGCVLVLGIIAALTGLAVYDLAARIGGPRVALLTWAAVCLTVPFIPYSWLIFPEVPAALGVAWAALWVQEPVQPRSTSWIWRGVVLGLLPWLHTKYVVLTAIFAAALLLRLWRRPKAALAFTVPMGVSIGLWLWSFYVIYGVFDPEAPYGAYTEVNVLMRNIPRGLLGLLFDQKFGLLFYSPIYLVSIAGCWLMLRRPDLRYLGAVMLLTVAAFVGSTTRLYMWWGGSSAPARFLVPILPCFAPMIAEGLRAARGATARALVGVWMAISLAIAAVGMGWPERFFLFSEPHGVGRLLETIQAGSPLARSFPTFTNPDWASPLRALGPWLLSAGLAIALMAAAARWRRPAEPWLAALGSMAFLLAAGAMTGRAAPEVRQETSRRGASDLLTRYDAGLLRGFDYRELQKADSARLLQLASVVTRPATPGPAGVAGPFSLPQGTYEARIQFAGQFGREGEITIASPEGALFGRAAGALQNRTVVPFELPVDVPRVWVQVVDEALAASVAEVEIAPTAIVSRSERVEIRPRAIESVVDRPGGYIVYLDDRAYPERGVFWTRHTDRASILVAPGAASRIVLILHLGPKSGDVLVSVAGSERTVRVEADSIERVEVEVPRGLRLVPITIQSAVSFRPSDVDPASGDQRMLGCQTRITLE